MIYILQQDRDRQEDSHIDKNSASQDRNRQKDNYIPRIDGVFKPALQSRKRKLSSTSCTSERKRQKQDSELSDVENRSNYELNKHTTEGFNKKQADLSYLSVMPTEILVKEVNDKESKQKRKRNNRRNRQHNDRNQGSGIPYNHNKAIHMLTLMYNKEQREHLEAAGVSSLQPTQEDAKSLLRKYVYLQI